MTAYDYKNFYNELVSFKPQNVKFEKFPDMTRITYNCGTMMVQTFYKPKKDIYYAQVLDNKWHQVAMYMNEQAKQLYNNAQKSM